MARAFVGIALAFTLTGCPGQASERELLIRANTLAMQGRTDDARRLFEDTWQRNPTSPEVLIRYLGFLVETGDLRRARTFIDALERAELSRTDRGRAQAEERKYYQALLDGAAGPMDPFPRDAETWEEAMVGLLRIERGGPLLDAWGDYLVHRLRAELGAPPRDALRPEQIEERAAALAPDAARRALDLAQRSLHGDPRLGFRPLLPSPTESEVRSIVEVVDRLVFDLDFDDRFARLHQRRFEAMGRYERDRRAFTIHHVAPWANGISAESPVELLEQQARTWYAREIATDLAYEFAEVERADAPPLPFALRDFDRAEAWDLGVTETHEFEFDVRIPYDTVRRGAWLLRQRLEASANEAAPRTPR